MKAQQITVTQYAEIRGISTQAVRKAIKEGWILPGITKVQMFGKTYILTYKPE